MSVESWEAMELPERKSSGKKEEENSCKQSYCHCLLVKANTIKVKKGEANSRKREEEIWLPQFCVLTLAKNDPISH